MTLPEGGGDNLYRQGSAVSLGFEWRAAALPAATPPTPTPAPVAPAPVTPAAGPTATPAPAPTADELGLPPARACASRRKFTITLKAPRGLSVVSATIAVNGKIKARVKGGRKEGAGRPPRAAEGPREGQGHRQGLGRQDVHRHAHVPHLRHPLGGQHPNCQAN